MNSRPYGPEPYALPNCATPRYIMMLIIFVRNVLPVFGSASRAHRRFCVSCSLSVDGCSLPAVRVVYLLQPKLRYTPMYFDVDYLRQKRFDLQQITRLSYVDTANYISNIIFRCQENNLAAPWAICYLQSARQVVKYIRPIMIRRHYAIIQILQSHKGLFRT